MYSTSTSTGYVFQCKTAISAVQLPHWPTIIRVFTSSSSYHAPCPEQCLISHGRQIAFLFVFNGVRAYLALNLMPNTCWDSAHQPIETRLRLRFRSRDDFPIEEQGLCSMIEFAMRKARAAVGRCIPSDSRIVYMGVSAMSYSANIRRLQSDDWMENGGRFAAPADDRAIESLTINKLSSSSSSSEYLGTCTICLEDFLDGEEASRMPCSHGFHGHCIRKWLKNSHYCPMCRFQLPAAA